MDELLQEFIAETRETLEALSGEIVAWEADPADRGRLDAIFRFVHTVKGSCGFLDLPRLERLSHAAEDVLAAVRAGERTPDTALVDAVLAVVDRIGEIVEAIAAGDPHVDSGEDLLIAALDGRAAAVPVIEYAAPVGGAAPRAVTRSVRLGVELLDRMMSGMSDMVLARNELARKLREDGADPRLEAALDRLSTTVAEMRDTVTRTRMQKVETLFSALPRMVRDTAASLNKAVTLHIEGSDVELDREMVELMRDPLVHIVRNAIDHGLETPTDRRRAGKRETGRLTVSARQSGNQIIIDIADDGRGIDTERLVAKLGALPGQDAAALRDLPDRARLDLIFHPGLSTKDEATAVSGRGVGMDVVRANVEQIGGRVELVNAPGRGLTVSIHVPLTLSIISTVIVGVGEHRFAVPRQAVEEIVTMRGHAVRIDRIGDAAIATVRERRLPLIDLGVALGLDPVTEPMLVILGVRDGAYALAVDQVLDTEELVVKPAAPAIMAAGVYAGQTLPDSGLPMLLLDGAGIAERAGVSFDRAMLADEEAYVAATSGIEALLFIDLDGQRRAVPLAVVDRVETVPTTAIRWSAGRLRMAAEDGLQPLVARGDLDGLEQVQVLRLTDGEQVIGYAIAAATDIVTLPAEIATAPDPGPIAGAILLDGEQVELLDAYWLFGEETQARSADAPLCLLHADEDGWMQRFLRPTLEAAGYRVANGVPDESASVALTLAAAPGMTTAPLVKLCREPGGARHGQVYRYDRAGVLAAVAKAVGRAA